MGKRYKNLLEQITNIDNIRLAYKKAVKGGNRYTVSHLKFKENLEANLYLIQEQLNFISLVASMTYPMARISMLS